MKPQTRIKKVQVVLRIPEDLAVKIDTYASRLSETHKGFNFSRSDVMRHLLEKGMVKVDEEAVDDAG